MHKLFLVCSVLFLALLGCRDRELIQGLSEKGAQFERLAAGFRFAEGPAFSPEGFLLVSDIPNDRIVRVNLDGSTSDYLKPSEFANGLYFGPSGGLYICQEKLRRIIRIKNGEARTIANRFNGKLLNSPNDLVVDRYGGIYFTDPRYDKVVQVPGLVEQPVMGVYYIDNQQKLSLLVDTLVQPNGIALSPTEDMLYVAEPSKRQIYRYKLLSPGVVSKAELFFEGDSVRDQLGPDGMTVDSAGNVYASYASLVVLSSSGKVISRVSMPERPTNATLGSSEGRRFLFITSASSVYSLQMKLLR